MLGKTSSFYNQSYDGYTFILPDHFNRKPIRRSFSNAQQWCKRNVAGSTLATILTNNIQRDFKLFIESALKDNEQLATYNFNHIRLNGKYHITDEWHWINGGKKAGMRRQGFLLLRIDIFVNNSKH